MQLATGDKLGPYQIVAPLGAGGMGEVYRATDTKLGRDVAIKILPASFAQDPERMARFEREAKVLASLNHPNIAQIFGIEERALVMELVEGESLKGPLPLDTALDYARQIADALEAAHEKGIVHRDLKPGNIMVTASGVVKVLDFGLAKAAEEPASETQNSPTITMSPTRAGVILGTAPYMAPEQARGKTVDKRADIWAFGCVLFEMLTANQAFTGETSTDILAAVVKTEPDLSQIPSRARRLIELCLKKDPRQRLQAIGDWRIPLDTPDSPVAAAKIRWPWLWTAALVVAAALGIMAGWVAKPARSAVVSHTMIDLPSGIPSVTANRGPLAFSPDGAELVYSDDRRLYLRSLDRFEATPLPGTEGGQSPFFSPDGQWIGFFGGARLNKVSIHGGAPVPLCETIGSPNSASWGPGGMIVFAPRGGQEGLRQTSDSGGNPRILTTPDTRKGEYAYFWPEVLPDSSAVIFTVLADSESSPAQIVVQSLKTGERHVLIQGGVQAHYLSSGYLIYRSSGNLMAAPFDAKRLRVTGTPIPVIEGVLHTDDGAGLFSLSATGSLLYAPGGLVQTTSRFVWVDRKGASTPLAAPPRSYDQFSLSPNGKQIVTSLSDGPRSDIWMYDIVRNAFTRLTFQGDNRFPIWTLDGKRIGYQSTAGGPPNLFWKPADGSGSEKQLTRSETDAVPNTWSPGGKELIFVVHDPVSSSDLWVMPANDFGKARPWLRTAAAEEEARFSPDGHWLAYISDETGRFEVYVRPFPGPGGKWEISTEGGAEPLWSPSGKELFYRSGNKMMAVDVTTDGSFSAGAPKLLFVDEFVLPNGPIGTSAVSPNGQRFLMLEPVESSQPVSQLNLVLNWSEELKKKVPRQ